MDAAGVDYFIAKPVSFKSLSDTIGRITETTAATDGFNTVTTDSYFPRLLAFLGISEESVKPIFLNFVDAALPQYIDEIDMAMEPFNCDKILRAAHKLKGLSGSLLLDDLKLACSILENAANADDAESTKTAVSRIHEIACTIPDQLR